MDPYTTLAGCQYTLVAFTVSVICFVYAIRNPLASAAVYLSRSFIFAGAVVLGLLLFGTAVIIGYVYLETAPVGLIPTARTFWLFVIFAAPMVPLGVELQNRTLARYDKPAHPAWLVGVVLAIAAFIGSTAWMLVTGGILSIFDIKIVPSPQLMEIMKDDRLLLMFTPIALAAAIIEEIIFRLGLQGLLEELCRRAKMPLGLAVLGASLVWALGHAGMVTPHGIKEIQILGIGLLFGWAKLRYGVRASIYGHLGLNGGAIVFQFLFDTPVG